MKLKWILLSIVLLPALANANPATPADGFDTKLDSVSKLIKEGNYSEARALYKDILASPDLSAVHKQAAMTGYQNLNTKILFSKHQTPTSELYEVKPGDSLYVIAKKYSTTIDLIKLSNGLEKNTIYPGMKLKIETGTFSIEVDKSENVLRLLLNGEVFKIYRVATGTNNNTPVGTFEIQNKLTDPTWYKDGKAYPHDDPENILGTRWMGFDLASYGIHGTTKPETIGTQASSGCVRMLNEEVEELFSIVPRGTKVTITD